MRRPDRIGAVVIIFGVFAMYLALASLLTTLGLPLPLGTVGSEVPLIAVTFVFLTSIFLGNKRLQKQESDPTKSI